MPNREKAIILREQHPHWTLQEIGDKLHLSGERVRQILKSEEKITKGYFLRKADIRRAEVLYHFNPYVSAGKHI